MIQDCRLLLVMKLLLLESDVGLKLAMFTGVLIPEMHSFCEEICKNSCLIGEMQQINEVLVNGSSH